VVFFRHLVSLVFAVLREVTLVRFLIADWKLLSAVYIILLNIILSCV